MRVTQIDVRIVGQNVNGDGRILVRAAAICHGDGPIVGAGDGQRDGGGGLRPVIVRHGVGQRDGCRLAKGQILIIGARIVDHLVGDDGRAAAARGDGHGINCMGVTEVNVGIVRQNVDGHRRVFVRAAAICHRNGTVIRTRNGQ